MADPGFLEHLLFIVDSLIKQKDSSYSVEVDRSDPDKILLVNGPNQKEDEIGRVTINIEDNTCNIPFLTIEEGYRGRKLGILLLLYGMLRAKIVHPNITEYKLDDNSDNRNKTKQNIYINVGFVEDNPEEGPEKTATFENFLSSALEQIASLSTSAGIKKRTKHKRKTKRNLRHKIKRSRNKQSKSRSPHSS